MGSPAGRSVPPARGPPYKKLYRELTAPKKYKKKTEREVGTYSYFFPLTFDFLKGV